MSYIEAARKLPWWCELCERMHPIGKHTEPGVSWPPSPPAPPRPPPDPDYYRCSCGLHLFATEKTTSPAIWARHVAHIRAFQQETQRLIAGAITAWGLPDPGSGPCALCRKQCQRYGDGGKPLCDACQKASHDRRPARRTAPAPGSPGEGRPQSAQQTHHHHGNHDDAAPRMISHAAQSIDPHH